MSKRSKVNGSYISISIHPALINAHLVPPKNDSFIVNLDESARNKLYKKIEALNNDSISWYQPTNANVYTCTGCKPIMAITATQKNNFGISLSTTRDEVNTTNNKRNNG
jgi:hypothetical protein